MKQLELNTETFSFSVQSQSQPPGEIPSILNVLFSLPPGSSAPVDPDSPISVGLSSTATSVSEVDELLGDIISLESVDATMDKDLAMFDHHVHTSQTVSIHGY